MDVELTLVEHLSELRKRIIVVLLALGGGAIASFPLASVVLRVLKLPAAGLINKLVFFSPQDAFVIRINIAIFTGMIIAMPVILYQLWAFVSPALSEKIKQYAVSFVFFSFSGFILGACFAYFILIPSAMKFLLGFAGDDLEPIISAQKYISFLISLIVGCGLVFQMPIISFILTRVSVINSRFLRNKYKYAIVIIFIIAAIITPTPDAFNMFLFACPMLFLYELSIWVSFLFRVKNKA